jgi:prephenate dehydratase
MINFLKNIIPVTLFIVGKIIETVGNLFIGVSAIIGNMTATIHVQLNTNTGKKLKEIQKSMVDAMKLYTQVANKVANSKKDENRLANVINPNPNVVQLGKKKDDPTKS